MRLAARQVGIAIRVRVAHSHVRRCSNWCAARRVSREAGFPTVEGSNGQIAPKQRTIEALACSALRSCIHLRCLMLTASLLIPRMTVGTQLTVMMLAYLAPIAIAYTLVTGHSAAQIFSRDLK